MSNAFSFLRGLSGNEEREFWDELEAIKVRRNDDYIIEEYTGKTFTLRYQLVLKKGFFTKDVIIGSDKKFDVETVRDYIGYFPQFNKLSIIESPIKITNGNFKIKQVLRMTGVEGKHGNIEQIVRKWNGGEEAIDYIINGVEEIPLGYLPTADSCMAKAYVDLINAGAKREATPEEIASIKRDLAAYINKLNAK